MRALGPRRRIRVSEHEAWLLGLWLAGLVAPSIGRTYSGPPVARLPYLAHYREPIGNTVVTGQPYWVLKAAADNHGMRLMRHRACSLSTFVEASVRNTLQQHPGFYKEFYCEHCAAWAPAGEFEL